MKKKPQYMQPCTFYNSKLFVSECGPHTFGTNSTTHTDRGLTEAGVVCKVPVEGVTLPLLIASAPAGAPQADGDVGGTAVTVVWCYI